MATRTRQRSPTQNVPSATSRSSKDRREITAQYAAGKQFKVKCIGSQDLNDYEGESAVASECMNQVRQECIRLKSKKLKATITLQLKEFTILEEKSKIISLSVPITKVKSVCHDRKDISVFGVIIQKSGFTRDSGSYKLYVFQAEEKLAISFVCSAKELFLILHKMKAKQQTQSQGSVQSSSNPSPQQDIVEGLLESLIIEESLEQADETKNLGFDIQAPPPSYDDFLRNVDLYKIPENIQVDLDPPTTPSSGRLSNVSPGQTRAIVLPHPQTTPTLPTVNEVSSNEATLSGPPRPMHRTLDPHTLENNYIPDQIQHGTVTPLATHQSNSPRGQSSTAVQATSTGLTLSTTDDDGLVDAHQLEEGLADYDTEGDLY